MVEGDNYKIIVCAQNTKHLSTTADFSQDIGHVEQVARL
jgi:hypothetical protein